MVFIIRSLLANNGPFEELPTLKTTEFVLNRVYDRFHESENLIEYSVTHLHRVLFILAHAAASFNIYTTQIQ